MNSPIGPFNPCASGGRNVNTVTIAVDTNPAEPTIRLYFRRRDSHQRTMPPRDRGAGAGNRNSVRSVMFTGPAAASFMLRRLRLRGACVKYFALQRMSRADVAAKPAA